MLKHCRQRAWNVGFVGSIRLRLKRFERMLGQVVQVTMPDIHGLKARNRIKQHHVSSHEEWERGQQAKTMDRKLDHAALTCAQLDFVCTTSKLPAPPARQPQAWRSRGSNGLLPEVFPLNGRRQALVEQRQTLGTGALALPSLVGSRQSHKAGLEGRRMATAHSHRSGKRLGHECGDCRCLDGHRWRESGQREMIEFAHALPIPLRCI